MIWGYHHFKKSIVYDEMWNGINSEAVFMDTSMNARNREWWPPKHSRSMLVKLWTNRRSFWYSSDYQLPYFFWMLLMCRHLRTSDTPGFRLFFCHCCASDCSRSGSWKWNAAPKPQLFFRSPRVICDVVNQAPVAHEVKTSASSGGWGALPVGNPVGNLVTFPCLRMVREQPVLK